jgi:membrane protease YdiL (CAAX protease family)
MTTSRVRAFASRAGSRLVLGLFGGLFVLGVGQGASAVLGVAGAVLSVVLSLGAYVGFVRFFERRAVDELRPASAPEVLMGLLAGTALFAATIGVIAAFGGYHVLGRNPLTVAGPMLSVALISGVGEELVLRGIVFRVTEELLGTWGSLAVSAALFGVLHLTNPNATLTAAISIALEAGVLLAAAFLISRRLWFAMGLHAGWNFTQGGVFGVAVSGNEAKGLLVGSLSGPEWLSGGAFGAEASLVAVVLCLTAAIPLLLFAAKRGQWRAAPWRRA